MRTKCVYCGAKNKELYARVAIKSDGTQHQVPLCDNCYETVRNMNRIHTAELGAVDLLPEDTPFTQPQAENTGWESFLKSVCIISVILSTIAGGVMLAEEADGIIFFIIGSAAGFLISMVAVAIIMIICEISTTLKKILAELQKNNDK